MSVVRASVLLFCCTSLLAADDGVVTIQYFTPEKKELYRATGLLSDDAMEEIHRVFPASKDHTWNLARGESINRQTAADLAENYREVKAVLSQLKNGDVLVLNVHSSAEKVGYSTEEGKTEDVEWGRFWAAYGIERPPRLALVVLNGCMGTDTGGSTDEHAEAIRCALNATALVSARTTIDTIKSQKELVTFLRTIGNERTEFAPEGPTFRMVKSRLLAGEKVSLRTLRERAKLLGMECEVTKETEDRDVVTAVEDEPDPVIVPAEGAVVPWQNRGKDAKGWTSIRFEFRPRREIERIEFVARVRAPQAALNDSFLGNVEGEAVRLIEKFRVSKKDETVDLKQEWSGRMLNLRWPKLLKQVQSGKLRCALGSDVFLEQAYLVVHYK